MVGRGRGRRQHPAQRERADATLADSKPDTNS
jgi:hypothetical protein